MPKGLAPAPRQSRWQKVYPPNRPVMLSDWLGKRETRQTARYRKEYMKRYGVDMLASHHTQMTQLIIRQYANPFEKILLQQYMKKECDESPVHSESDTPSSFVSDVVVKEEDDVSVEDFNGFTITTFRRPS